MPKQAEDAGIGFKIQNSVCGLNVSQNRQREPPNKPFEYMYLDTQINLKPFAVLLSLHWISDIVTPDLNHGRT